MSCNKKIGDTVQSTLVKGMTGVIRSINADGTGMVDVKGSLIYTSLDYWFTADGR